MDFILQIHKIHHTCAWYVTDSNLTMDDMAKFRRVRRSNHARSDATLIRLTNVTERLAMSSSPRLLNMHKESFFG